MRIFVPIVVLAACGGSTPPPAAPAQTASKSASGPPPPPPPPPFENPQACVDGKADDCIAALDADCKNAKPASCGALGVVFDDAEQYDVAFMLYQKACDANVYGYCNNLGRLYKYG